MILICELNTGRALITMLQKNLYRSKKLFNGIEFYMRKITLFYCVTFSSIISISSFLLYFQAFLFVSVYWAIVLN
jgi:hypothetical protein